MWVLYSCRLLDPSQNNIPTTWVPTHGDPQVGKQIVTWPLEVLISVIKTYELFIPKPFHVHFWVLDIPSRQVRDEHSNCLESGFAMNLQCLMKVLPNLSPKSSATSGKKKLLKFVWLCVCVGWSVLVPVCLCSSTFLFSHQPHDSPLQLTAPP